MFNFKKDTSIPLDKFFQYIKPKYIYIKLTPDKSIRNYNSSNIAKAIKHTYKAINKRIKWENKKLWIEINFKIAYIIDIKKSDVGFYFMVPKVYQDIIIEKVREIWPRATLETIEVLEQHSKDAECYQLTYKNEDAMSLNVDKKSNEPLNSILSVNSIMKDDDRVTIIYNFQPRRDLGWAKQYSETIEKFNSDKPILREKTNPKYIAITLVTEILRLVDDAFKIIGEFSGIDMSKNNSVLLESALALFKDRKELSNATKRKKDLGVINCQIGLISNSVDATRKENNALAVAHSYRALDEDNELIVKKLKKDIRIDKYDIGTDINIVSTDECSNFIQLPGRTLLDEHNISHIDTLESEIPEQLRSGVMCIGTNTYKGVKQKAYLTSDKEFKNLTLCLIGPTRAGKTTLISNLSRDAVKAGETTIILDWCGNCDLSDEVSKVIDKKKILNIDCSDINNLQGFGYNEIKPLDNSEFQVYRCAKTNATQLKTLINCLSDGSELQARMETYLECAAIIVFLVGGSVKDIFEVLQDHNIRHKYIKNIPLRFKEKTEKYINRLHELDEYSKATKDNPAELIGTKLVLIQGILNRINKLNENAYVEAMLSKGCENNIDLFEEIQKAQLICIKIPEIMFQTEEEKDIYCTYWLTKIWSALQIRKFNIPDAEREKRIKVNIIFDELYQVPICQEFLRKKISQIAKFDAKPIISCHYLKQISGIREELKSANASYMMIAGCDKANFNELREELYPYELEDLLNLKRFYSLNLLKYENGWTKFITELPPKIK